jgi:hypothetical protein
MSSKKESSCRFSKSEKIMIRLLQIMAVVCVVDIAYVFWRCMS